MDPTDHTNTMILDLRVAVARIETKLDGHHEAHQTIDKRFETIEAAQADLDARVTANTAEIATSKTRFATLAAVASAIFAILSLLGEHLWSFIAGH